MAAVIAAVVIIPNLWAPLSPFDGGITSSAAAFTLHGQLPYRDYWLLYGPLGGWLLAIPTAVAGPSVLLTQVAGLAVALGQAAIGYLLVRRWAGHFVGLLVSVAAACVPPLFLGLALAAWSLGLLLALSGLYLVFETTARPWLAGFVIGLAFLTRLDVGGYALLAAMAGRNRAQVVAGVALTVAPVAALLLATTPPGLVVRPARVVPAHRSAAVPVTVGSGRLPSARGPAGSCWCRPSSSLGWRSWRR